MQQREYYVLVAGYSLHLSSFGVGQGPNAHRRNNRVDGTDFHSVAWLGAWQAAILRLSRTVFRLIVRQPDSHLLAGGNHSIGEMAEAVESN
jgi:hypothetical protein